MTRAYGLDLPDSPLISPNDRAHWSKRAECAQVWRTASRLLAKQARIPRMDRISVSLDHWPKTKRRQDTDRISLVAKWCVDGIVDAGVVDDDDSTHVPEVVLRMHPPRADKQRTWLLTITELAL